MHLHLLGVFHSHNYIVHAFIRFALQGTEVEDVWGFTYSMLDWSELKRRSNIYERFANVQMDFELNVKKMDFDPSTGPGGDRTNAYTLLAHSDNSDLLNDSNSIRVETESLHGIWENRYV